MFAQRFLASAVVEASFGRWLGRCPFWRHCFPANAFGQLPVPFHGSCISSLPSTSAGGC